jgi:hypothetical protein
VERANGSTIAIPSGRLLIPISSVAWISLERQRAALRSLPGNDS